MWEVIPRQLNNWRNTMNIKKITALSTALLMTAAMSSAMAEEGDMTQTRVQERQQLNLQVADVEKAMERMRKREQKREKQVSQAQNEYRYKNNIQSSQNRAISSSTSRQSMGTHRAR
jgi:hypothetical protein